MNDNKEMDLLKYINEVNKHMIKFLLSNVTKYKCLKNEILTNFAMKN